MAKKQRNGEILDVFLDHVFPIGLLAGGAFFAWKFFFKKGEGDKTVKAAKSELQKLLDAGMRPSYSDSQYLGGANQMEWAMRGVTGSDEDTIYKIMALVKNNVDFLKLLTAFGTRTYTVFGIPSGDRDLYGWFSEELDPDEIAKVNSILKKNGVNYYF